MKTHFVTTVTMYYTEPDAEIGGEYKLQKNADGTDQYVKLETRRGPKDTSRELLKLTTDAVDIGALALMLRKAHKKAQVA